ncbi:MAG: hypothetical protein KF832_31220 [Caldilineaceae bacterium]|nr:hypothetical protein [Caldilineaceae bacterium]
MNSQPTMQLFAWPKRLFARYGFTRWGLITALAGALLLTQLLPVAALGGAPCKLNGNWYPDGTIIHGGPVLQVCNDGKWRAVVFHQWELIQRLDVKLLEKFKTIAPLPDPQPWCLSCPPTLSVKFDSKTTQLVEQEMNTVITSLNKIQQIIENDPAYR